MKIFLELDTDGTILGWGTSLTSDISVEIEVDEDHEVLTAFHRYKYIDGELVRLSDEEIDTIEEEALIEIQESDMEEQLKMLKKRQQMSDLALLELTDFILGGLKGGEH